LFFWGLAPLGIHFFDPGGGEFEPLRARHRFFA